MKPGLMVVLAMLLAASTGCTSPTGPPPVQGDPGPKFAAEYRIGIGDSLRVDVWRHDELSVSVPVRPDGRITVPVAGDIDVGGQLPEEVAARITEKLQEYVREPVVTVTVTGTGGADYLSRVRVTGAVSSPSSIPYRQGMTVMDLVLEAGGINDYAQPSKTVLYRDGERISIRLDRILAKGDMSTNMYLQPGDIVTIPERIF